MFGVEYTGHCIVFDTALRRRLAVILRSSVNESYLVVISSSMG